MKTASELGVDPVYQLNSSERRFISGFTASELTELREFLLTETKNGAISHYPFFLDSITEEELKALRLTRFQLDMHILCLKREGYSDSVQISKALRAIADIYAETGLVIGQDDVTVTLRDK